MRFLITRLLLCAALTLGLAPTASATWSVILVNRVTAEVVVAGATCLQNLDLQQFLPVIRVGHGGACAQSLIDSGANNRKKIWNGFQSGQTPAQILSLLAATDFQHKSRQYGIVDRFNPPVGFTGNSAGAGKLDLSGSFGDWSYSVQGNVLTSASVVQALEAALQLTNGDGGQRVMAAMQAAYALGGDGRCSCSASAPTSCGAPPPSFTKSAHVGFLQIARVGDIDGVCTGALGCANGQYFLDLNVIGSLSSPDPVLTLQGLYDAWRAGRIGLPDHLTSSLSADVERLVADGQSAAWIQIQLKDIDGQPLAGGGAQLALSSASGGALLGSLGPVEDLGAGSYRVRYTAGQAAGLERLRVSVSGAGPTVVLQPDLELPIDPLAALHSGFSEVSAAAGSSVPLTLNLAPSEAFLLLASAAGTAPGLALPFGSLPLNYDAILEATLLGPNTGPLVGTLGSTGLGGWAQARIETQPGALAPLIGLRLDWAALRFAPDLSAVGPVGFGILP
jgi:hypothetical protein